MTNSDLRNPAHYARLSREFPGGAEYANIVRDLTNKTIHVLDRALADGFEVAAHVPDSKRRRIEGVICFDSKVPKIIPLRLSQSLVTVDGTPVFVRHARGVEMLYHALCDAIESVFCTATNG